MPKLKPTSERGIQHTFHLPKPISDIITQQPNKSKYVAQALAAYREYELPTVTEQIENAIRKIVVEELDKREIFTKNTQIERIDDNGNTEH